MDGNKETGTEEKRRMNFLVIGGGAREHAIADALICGGGEVYAYTPTQNPGIIRSAKGYAIGRMDDNKAAVKFAKEKAIEIAVIGPEAPLAAGMTDEFEKNDIMCVGPDKEHAKLETSKSFTRELLQRHGINASPTFRVFHSNEGIKELLKELGEYAVKPDGLTGGKGVKISGEHLQSNEEALSYCKEILKTHNAVVIEEKLEGEEFSLQTLTDGNGGFLHFPAAQDHKRAFENDTGANTGGMGSYSDADWKLPFLTDADIEEAKRITEKVATAIKKETGKPYKGVMYGGFMKTASGIKLLEYNARFGDPEAMNVLPILKTSFAEICATAAQGKLNGKTEFQGKATVCKYVAPEGYPDNPQTGPITIPSYEKDGITALVYYASVEQKNGEIHTTKSRAVAFVGIADTIEEAEKTAEEGASKVKGKVYHRKDIGTRQLLQKRIEHMRSVMKWH